MKIDDFLSLEDIKNSIEEIKRNDEAGKSLIMFTEHLNLDETGAGIKQMLILFNPLSQEIKTIKLYGFDLENVCDCIDFYGTFMGIGILHYMKDINSFPETLVLLTNQALM